MLSHTMEKCCKQGVMLRDSGRERWEDPEKWRYVMERRSEEEGGEGGPQSFGRAEATGWLDIGY